LISQSRGLGDVYKRQAHMVGAAIAASFAGWIRVLDGSYFIAWMTAGILCLLATATTLVLLRKRYRVAKTA
jgi:hypothetical protein